MKVQKFIDYINTVEKDNYEFIDTVDPDTLTNNRTKYLIKHLKCGNSYLINYHDFYSGRRCAKCCKYRNRRTTEDVKKELATTDADYELKSEYIGCNDPLKMLHKKCGREFTTTYLHFFGKKEYHLGNRCPFCSHGHKLRDLEDVKNEVKNISNNEYIILDTEYKGNKEKLTFKHLICNRTFKMRLNGFNSSRI